MLNYRYGIKANFGYNIDKDFAAFINYGTALVDYDVRWVTEGLSYGQQASSQIYGAGLIYNINDTGSAKLAYDHQTSNLRYVFKGLNSRARTDVAKLGLIYNF